MLAYANMSIKRFWLSQHVNYELLGSLNVRAMPIAILNIRFSSHTPDGVRDVVLDPWV